MPDSLCSLIFMILMWQKEDYHLDTRRLILLSPPVGKFTLEIATEIYPQSNTSLEVI